MRINFTRTAILTLFIFFTLASSASVTPASPYPKQFIERICGQISAMKMKDYEKWVGHHLKFREKIAFLVLKARSKRYAKHGIPERDYQVLQKLLSTPQERMQPTGKDESGGGLGQTALVIGIAAAALLIIGLFVPYVIIGSLAASITAIVMGSSALKANRSDRKASAGKLLGWITLLLIALLIILAAIVIASWSWSW